MDWSARDWEKIKALFESALEQPIAARTAFLKRNCETPGVYSEVAGLLRNHEAAGSFLCDSFIERQALPADFFEQLEGIESAAPGLPEFAPSSMIGCRIGAYQVEKHIGSGGMASVYLGRRADAAYEKRVAIKLVSIGPGSSEILERFRRERQTLASLDHPNIVRLVDGGSTEQGFPFLVMDYVEGTPIDQYCDSHTLLIEERLQLFCHVCTAVQHAHNHSVVHRDLKPANILVTQEGMPKLLDFGIAKVLEPSGASEALLTQTSARRLTPAYASPEQIRGGVISTASDVYSLGVVLYELLTGHRPYAWKRITAMDIERAICEEEPEFPSTAVVRTETTSNPDGSIRTITPETVSRSRGVEPEQLRSCLRGDLDKVVLKALQKEPGRRYAGVGELAGDIERYLQHLPVTAETDGWSYRFAKFARRHKVEVVAATFMLFAAIAGVAFLWQTHVASRKLRSALLELRSKSRISVAVMNLRNESQNSNSSWLATALPEMLTTELAAGGRMRAISRDEVSQTRKSLRLPESGSLRRSVLTQLYNNLGSDLVVLGSYRQEAGPDQQLHVALRVEDAGLGETVATFAEDGSLDALPDLIARAGADLRDKLGIPRISSADSVRAQLAFSQNREAARLYAEGISRLQDFDTLGARELLQKAAAIDANNPLIHSGLAEAWGTLGYDSKARDEAEKAFELSGGLPREQALWIEGRYRQMSRQSERAAEIYRTLFTFYPDNLRYGLRLASVQKGKEALATIESLRHLPPPARDDPWIDVAETDAAGGMGDLRRQAEAARSAIQKATQIGARMLEGRARITLGKALDQLGENDKALLELTAGKQILGQIGDRFGEGRALRFMGSLYVNQGNFAKARAVEKQALEIMRELGNRATEAQLLNNLANVLAHQGDPGGSIDYLKQSLAISRELGSRTAMAVTLGNLATSELDQRRIKDAKAHFQEALEIHRQAEDQVGVGVILTNFAAVFEAEGDSATAKAMLEEAIATNRKTGRATELGMGLINLGNLQIELGVLPAAKASFREAVQVLRESKRPTFLGDAIEGLGEIALLQDDFTEAHKQQDEALAQRQAVGDRMYIAQSWFARANLEFEEQHWAGANRLATDAAVVFREETNTDLELQADAFKARTLLAEGKLNDALFLMAEVSKRCADLEDVPTHIVVDMAEAEIETSSGNLADSEALLTKVGEIARKGRLLRLSFEARLALGKLQVEAGKKAAGQARLASLERDAQAKGFRLIARKASAARRQLPN
jgi:serine/threonine protein kinase/Tfp pilus assembly protein PilF